VRHSRPFRYLVQKAHSTFIHLELVHTLHDRRQCRVRTSRPCGWRWKISEGESLNLGGLSQAVECSL